MAGVALAVRLVCNLGDRPEARGLLPTGTTYLFDHTK